MTYKAYVPLIEKKDRCDRCIGKMSYAFESASTTEDFFTHCVACGNQLPLPEKVRGR
jgi:hypothetical protein